MALMFGYAKIFQQIFDSSIADDWQVRHVFEDLLILANSDGVVDMTVDAIARRTNTPIEIVSRAITELEKADPKSRSSEHNGVRLKRLDDHREWGWWIVNHSHYRDLSTDEQYRAKTRERVRKFREKTKESSDVTLRNVTVTHVTPSRGSKQKQKADKKAEENTHDQDGLFPSCKVALAEKHLLEVTDSYHKDSRAVLWWLNEGAGTHYREVDSNLGLISARLSEPDVLLDHIKVMINRQVKLWKGTEFAKYLRPETLFNKTKFDSYYGQRDLPINTNGKVKHNAETDPHFYDGMEEPPKSL